MTQPPPPSITCPQCHATSYNPNDITHGYCGACHAYTTPRGWTPRPMHRYLVDYLDRHPMARETYLHDAAFRLRVDSLTAVLDAAETTIRERFYPTTLVLGEALVAIVDRSLPSDADLATYRATQESMIRHAMSQPLAPITLPGLTGGPWYGDRRGVAQFGSARGSYP